FHANLNTSLTNANLVLEGRTGIGDQGAWLFSSRRTYYDLIVGPIVKNLKLVDGDVSFPNFTDVQTRLSFGPFKGHKFFVNAVASRDGVDIVSGSGRSNPDSITVYNTTYNYTSSLTWNWVPSSSQLNSLTLSWYRNDGRTVFEGWLLDPALNRDEFKDIQNDSLKALVKLFNLNFYSDFSIQKFSLKDNYSLSHKWGLLETGFGTEWITGDLFFQLDIDDELKALIQNNPRHSAIVDQTKQVQNYAKLYTYIQNRFAVNDRLYVLPGLRLDYYGLIDRFVLSPRLQLSYALDPLTTLRSSWGVYYQSPGYEKLVDQRQFFDFSGENLNGLQPEKAIHYILGIDRWLDGKWLLKVEGYYKDFSDLIVQQKYTTLAWESSLTGSGDPHDPSSWKTPYPVERDSLTAVPVNGSWGEAYGLEFTLEMRNKSSDDRLSGWVTYALAWAQRYRDGAVIPFNYDQRHTINIVMNYNVNDWLTLGAYWRFGTNFPYTEPVGVRPRIQDGKPIIATDFAGKAILDVDYGNESNFNQERLPLYHRLDFRATARALFWGMRWEFYLDVINLYNHKNIIQYQFFVQPDGSLGRRDIGMFPIVPTIGFNARF
ncbi:MAG: TonB-dependent receptor, partial [Chlorobi bacterium]|nr:TonB-dependent receptor [Chlorobiota bacterium]